MLGQRIAQERRRLGLTQEAFAEALQVGRSAVAMMETGRSALDAQRLMLMWQKLNMDLLFILTGEKSDKAAAQFINWPLIEAINTAVERTMKEENFSLSPEKKTMMLKYLYLQFVAHGHVDDGHVADTLRLAA